MRIASYNIRKARGLDQRHDPGRIVDVINRLDADIVALQEADFRLGDRPAALPVRLIEGATDFDVAPVAETDGGIGFHGNAVLVRKGLKHKDIRRIELPGFEPRGAVAMTIEGYIPLTLVALHLGLMRRHRRQQLEAVVTEVASDERVVVVGDFNEWSQARGLEPLADRFDVLAPGRSFHARRPVAALDRIATTSCVAVVDAGVEESRLARRASDHLPVWASIAAAAG